MTNLKNLKIGVLYYVEWQDACCRTGWDSKDDMEEWFKNEECIVYETGWLAYKDDKMLGFYSRRSHFKDNSNSYGLIQKIPNTWIKKIKKLVV